MNAPQCTVIAFPAPGSQLQSRKCESIAWLLAQLAHLSLELEALHGLPQKNAPH